MTRFPWDAKGVTGATDDKDSNSDPNLSGPSPETTRQSRLGEWSTSRRELWCFYLYYVVRFLFFFSRRSFFPNRRPRATMGCPDSILARPNSRIFSTLLAMTRANRHSPNHVAEAPNVCYRIWDTFAIVRLVLPFLIASHAGVADEFAAFFLFMNFFCYA
jgi:hypothetical protein